MFLLKDPLKPAWRIISSVYWGKLQLNAYSFFQTTIYIRSQTQCSAISMLLLCLRYSLENYLFFQNQELQTCTSAFSFSIFCRHLGLSSACESRQLISKVDCIQLDCLVWAASTLLQETESFYSTTGSRSRTSQIGWVWRIKLSCSTTCSDSKEHFSLTRFSKVFVTASTMFTSHKNILNTLGYCNDGRIKNFILSYSHLQWKVVKYLLDLEALDCVYS